MRIVESARDVPVLAEYDVVVCGGGAAGCAAAIAASRYGAKTLLVEKDGYLGGLVTSGLVIVILSTNRVDFQGVWHEWARELERLGGIRVPDQRRAGFRGSVDPEIVKYAWDNLLSAAGVDLLHHVYAARGMVDDGVIKGVYVESKAGRQAILAGRVIDCTGDGIVGAQSGVPWEQGDSIHKYAMSLTKVFRVANIHWLEDWCTAEQYGKMMADLTAAIERGEYVTPVVTEKTRLVNYLRGKAWQLPLPRREMISVLSRVLKIDPLDPSDLTRAEREGRQQAWEAADFCRRYVPGFEDAYLLDTSAHIGVRSSRRLHGLATVTAEDAEQFVKYRDSIARSSWELDVWPADSYSAPTVPRHTDEWRERMRRLKEEGEYFDIRYGCVVAKDVDNLLMAGRCISAEHVAESSLRIQQTCMATGQAAGTAAAISLDEKTTPRELDPMRVIARLTADRAAVEPAFDVLRDLPAAKRDLAP